MAYQKLLVDNVTCSRRFHLTFDDAAPKQANVEVRCSFCDFVIYAAKNHPAVTLARQENLVKTGTLSDNIVHDCGYRDVLSERTIPAKSTPHKPQP